MRARTLADMPRDGRSFQVCPHCGVGIHFLILWAEAMARATAEAEGEALEGESTGGSHHCAKAPARAGVV